MLCETICTASSNPEKGGYSAISVDWTGRRFNGRYRDPKGRSCRKFKVLPRLKEFQADVRKALCQLHLTAIKDLSITEFRIVRVSGSNEVPSGCE